jgi:hypothetical protein
MAVIDHIDGPNRDIYLSADTVGTTFYPIDAYKEMRALRASDEDLRKFKLFMQAKGNDPKGGGKYTERYVVLLNGTRIIPYNVSHSLTVAGTVITDDGQEGIACFDRSPLSPTTIVDINYVPPQVEIITVSSGSGLSTEEHNKLFAVPTAASNAAAARTELATELAIIEYLKKIVKNDKDMTNGLKVYDDDGVTVILDKALLDKDNGPIAALASGVVVKERKSTV